MSIRAFTLIEVLIYIALLSFLMTGVFVSAAAIRASAEHSQSRARLIQEELYLSRYLEVAAQGAEEIVLPSTATSTELVLRVNGTEFRYVIEESELVRIHNEIHSTVSDGDIRVEEIGVSRGRTESEKEYIVLHSTLLFHTSAQAVLHTFNKRMYLP